MQIASIILAAGASKRFGQDDKRLALVDGQPMLRHVVERVLKCALYKTYVVTSAELCAAETVLKGLPVEEVVNANATAGMGTSVAAGVAALDQNVDGVFIVPGDMPDVSHLLMKRLRDAFIERQGGGIFMPVDSQGKQRNPVLWSKDFFSELASLSGPLGGKGLIKSNPDKVHEIVWSDDQAFEDIDTKESYTSYLVHREGQ